VTWTHQSCTPARHPGRRPTTISPGGSWDTHAQVAALDPAKFGRPSQVWDLLVRARSLRDSGWRGTRRRGRVRDPAFDDAICMSMATCASLKDARSGAGSNTLGRAPDGEVELDLVLTRTRLDRAQGETLGKRARST